MRDKRLLRDKLYCEESEDLRCSGCSSGRSSNKRRLDLKE